MTMIAPYSQAALSSAYQDGCRMLQSDIQPLNVIEDDVMTGVLREGASSEVKCDSVTSTKNDNSEKPRRKGILTQGKEQGSPCSPVLSSSSQETRKNIRKVRFCESVQCLLVVPSRKDYSNDQMRNLWYVDQEYKAIKNEIVITLKQMMKKFPAPENEQMCYRGLEFRTKEGALLKTMRRENAYDTVLGEQARQFDLDFNDPTLISILYQRAAEESCHDAILRAQKDAEQCSRRMLLKNDKRRTGSKRKLFFGLTRDGGISTVSDPPSSRLPTVMTRYNK